MNQLEPDTNVDEELDMDEEIQITCRKHNASFWQTPRNHLGGHGCPKCVCVICEGEQTRYQYPITKGCQQNTHFSADFAHVTPDWELI